MTNLIPIEPVEYLAIGHITRDITSMGTTPGGTVLYSAMTAHALGLKAGIVTACDPGFSLPILDGISIIPLYSEETTTFENIYTPEGRVQKIHQTADTISLSAIPETWRNTPLVHLAPVAGEIDPSLARFFSGSFVGLTAQGYLREWDQAGQVSVSEWPEAAFVLENCSAVVISIEDIDGDEARVEEMLRSIRVLAVTEGAEGARVYWNGDVRRFSPPVVKEIESTGAGDIFAACFFARYQATRDPWEAGRFAVQLAAFSVTRRGIDSIPTQREIEKTSTQIIQADR